MEPARGRLEADVERALMDVGVMAYAIDRDGLIFWQNHAHRRVIGEARGAHFNKFVAPEDRRRAQEAFVSKIVGTVPSTQYDVELHSSEARSRSRSTRFRSFGRARSSACSCSSQAHRSRQSPSRSS